MKSVILTICTLLLFTTVRCYSHLSPGFPFQNKKKESLSSKASRSTKSAFCSNSRLLTVSGGSSDTTDIETCESLLSRAKDFISKRDTDNAYLLLSQVYEIDPDQPGLLAGFESFFRLRIDMAAEKNDGMNNDNDKDLNALNFDRFGLASLLIDQERYEEASSQLRSILSSSDDVNDNTNDLRTKVISMLYRTNASACQWKNMEKDEPQLLSSTRVSLKDHRMFYSNTDDWKTRQMKETIPALPPIHPFEALKWPCIGLKDATDIAACYANRAICSSSSASPSPLPQYDCAREQHILTASSSIQSKAQSRSTKIKVGYISPDFTSKHPLAFLMQNVFQLHDRTHFQIHLYSFSRPPTAVSSSLASEVSLIQSGADHWMCSQNANKVMEAIEKDELDILIDLCGYAGTNKIAEIMARRLAPVQISYMGFPGSSGAPYIDYVLVDDTVIPRSTLSSSSSLSLSSLSLSSSSSSQKQNLRSFYTENLIYMPHCYFVNCHKTAMKPTLISSQDEYKQMRKKYELPLNAFVFCCHSRPDKIDPQTFGVWMRALKRIRETMSQKQSVRQPAVLWLLRSGQDMERNLRHIAKTEYQLEDDDLVFCDIAPRKEHLKRVGLADLFLDTPAYNAHTLGCDALYAGVPMVSLLRGLEEDHEKSVDDYGERSENKDSISTEKWVSRVGASLLKASGLDDMIVPNLHEYEDLMVRCYSDALWFEQIRESLRKNRDSCPLFDTERWVRNLEIGLKEVVRIYEMEDGDFRSDIEIQEDDTTVI